MVFWVTNNLLNDWIQLPDCRPQDIRQARLIKHVFSGDLNAEVDTNPNFVGKERHFLRATLARIFHGTAIVPKGMLNPPDEENPEVKFAEEWAFPKTEELKDLANWGNTYPVLLKAGRTKHLPPEGVPEEELQGAIDDLEAKDPTVERFRAISEHAPFGTGEGAQPSWISKVVGDQQQYTLEGAEGENYTFAVNVIKSLRWPGAVTVSKAGKCTSVYVGFGLKKGDPSYNPTEPPNVQEDPEEDSEMPEPNPLTPPEVQDEEDTMAEDKDPNEEDN